MGKDNLTPLEQLATISLKSLDLTNVKKLFDKVAYFSHRYLTEGQKNIDHNELYINSLLMVKELLNVLYDSSTPENQFALQPFIHTAISTIDEAYRLAQQTKHEIEME